MVAAALDCARRRKRILFFDFLSFSRNRARFLGLENTNVLWLIASFSCAEILRAVTVRTHGGYKV